MGLCFLSLEYVVLFLYFVLLSIFQGRAMLGIFYGLNRRSRGL